MIEEIPGFLHFLNNRKMTTQEESRMWFHPSIIKTDALTRLIENSRPKIEKELAILIKDLMIDFDLDELKMTTKLINKEFFSNRYEVSYINRVIKENLGCDQQKNTDGKYLVTQFTFPRWNTGPDDNYIKIEEKYIGRPWVFRREQFVKPDEIKELNTESNEKDTLPF
jgi:hypothetical protein